MITLQQARQSLDVAYNNIIEIQNTLDSKLNDELIRELTELEDDDCELSIHASYNLCDNDFSITLYYSHDESPLSTREFELDCEFARVIIETSTTDAREIKTLIEFCEKNILQ